MNKQKGLARLATAKGIFLIDKLQGLPSTKQLTSIEQTAELELFLQEMSEGISDDKNFSDLIHSSIITALDEWKNVITVPRDEIKKEKRGDNKETLALGHCPICNAEIRSFPKSYSCSRWREGCKFTVWKVVAKKKISEVQIEKIIKHKRSDLIKGFKSKTGKSFDAFLVMNQEGIVSFEFISH